MEAKEFSQKFMIQDIFGYFFPGLIGIIGLAMLAHFHTAGGLTELKYLKTEYSFLTLALLMSLPLGIVLSGPSWLLVHVIKRILKLKQPRGQLPLHGLEKDAIDAYNQLFQSKETVWTDTHFYFARTVVHEFMPRASAYAARQNSLRMFRMYLITPLIIWGVVGVKYGLSTNASLFWASSSILVSVLIIGVNFYRMQKNASRETREIITAFIGAVKMGQIGNGKTLNNAVN